MISNGAGLIFKGSGWYRDLYSSPKPEKPATSETSTPKEAPTTKKAESS
jgi:predicted nucleic acid-binding Zn ribbon protein